ncbi:MAG: hypothetical protein HY597_06990, partial [Candidatus Omnitrophica bacterium]|nr:hypothetical protein [Candidatus Omnitrophota bacterium]
MKAQAATRKVVAILQARVGSTRLPGKVLADICGQPMLWHQMQRIKLARRIDELVLATTAQPEDQPLAALAKTAGIPVFLGSSEDVLDRYYQAATKHAAELIVRLTGDCPLIDPTVIDTVVEYAQTHAVDYVGTGWDFPDGLDVEVFTMEALERAWREAAKPSEREHVALYMNSTGRFRTHRLSAGRDLAAHRWVVDEPDDLEAIRRIYEALYPAQGHRFTTEDILRLLAADPSIQALNGHIARNDGLLQSWKRERPSGLPRRHPLARSEELWQRAARIIPAGTQTMSKGPTQYVGGVAPKYLQRAQGSRVW